MTNWDQRYCPTCGMSQAADARFCGGCGTLFAAETGAPQQPFSYGAHRDEQPHGHPDDPPAPRDVAPASGDRKGTPLVLFASVLILAVTAASFTLLDEEDQEAAGQDAVPDGDQVLLEPLGHTGEHDFFSGLDLATVPEAEPSLNEIDDRVATLPPFTDGQQEMTTALAGQTVAGTEPGLYSGHRREGVCDLEGLADQLAGQDDDAEDSEDAEETEAGEDPQPQGDDGDGSGGSPASSPPAPAWANAQGLESPDDIDGYIDSLTPVRLRLDTRVTSHGFHQGETQSFQSLLQAGTGVLIDDTGVPRVACASGNPLSEPAPLDGASASRADNVDRMAANPQAAWDRLDPDEVVAVRAGDEPMDELLIVDIDTTDPLERPIGTNGQRDLGPGDFEATLRWDSSADLDLAVTDPNGASISAESPAPENSRGRLEEDANRQCEENMTGVERITWPNGDAPPGEYTVAVRGHAVGDAFEADCGNEPAEFTLTIKMFGQDDIVHDGSVADQGAEEYTITLGDEPQDQDEAEGDGGGEDGDGNDA